MRPGRNILLAGLMLAFLAASPDYSEAVSQEDLNRIWRNNGAVEGIQEFRFGLVDWQGGMVSVNGRAPLKVQTPSARLLARRAALTDARRNLLLLLFELRYGLPERIESIEIEGRVTEAHVDFSRITGDTYEIGLTLPLDMLLDKCVIFSASVE